MDVKWYIEKDFFWDCQPDTLLTHLKELNIPFELSRKLDCKDLPYSPDQCTIVYGSIEFAREINRRIAWVPGCSWVFGNKENFYCSTYYSHYADFLLNKDFIYMPLADLYRNRNFIFDIMSDGHGEWLFVRPDSPFKEFTGFLVHKNEVCKKIPTMSYGDLAPNLMVLIAKPKAIVSEYRFYIAKGEVITGSRYKFKDEYDEDANCSQKAYDLAMKLAKHDWLPAPIFTADISEDKDGECRLLEINGFNTSGMYLCDLKKIILKANEIAIMDWENYQREIQ